jgi:predicted histone-like DNA-binding protein
MDTREVCKRLSDEAGVHMGSVLAVMEALSQTVPKLLMDGYTVKLNDFGTFSLHVSANGQDEAEKVTPADIENIKMAFLPSKRIKHKLATTKFRKKK